MVKLNVSETDASRVVSISETSAWTTVVKAGGPATDDGPPITNPDTGIEDAAKLYFTRHGRSGTFLLFRLARASAAVLSAQCEIQLFGRTGDDDVWQRLKTRAGELVATLTADATNDINMGGFKYTAVDLEDHAFDCAGCNEFRVAVTQPAAASSGSLASSFIQCKAI